MSPATPRLRSGSVLLAGLVWLLLAVALGASGRLQTVRPPTPQVILLSLTAGLMLAGTRVSAFRDWAWSVDPRWLVGLHLTRFVGIYFLVLHARGELPWAFAVPGGWGDILVATLALLVLLSGPPDAPRRRRVYITWNLLGLTDIVLVVATAARLGVTEPTLMRSLLQLLLNLLPTFLVPLIICTHVLLLLRLGRAPEPPPGPETA